jgi:hypothetical protein
MDPVQVVRTDGGVMECRECGFRYNHTRAEIADLSEQHLARVGNALNATPHDARGVRLQPKLWSVNAYMAHLVEASGVVLERVQRVATEERPALAWFDENVSVERFGYDGYDADQSWRKLQPTVAEFAAFLRGLPDDAWERLGIHSTAGEVRMSEIAHDMAHELGHHADDIHAIGVERRVPGE